LASSCVQLRHPPSTTLFPYTTLFRSDDEGPRPAPAPTGAAPAGGPGAAEDRPDEPAPVRRRPVPLPGGIFDDTVEAAEHLLRTPDRKSTRLNSSHVKISYAVFCLKKK